MTVVPRGATHLFGWPWDAPRTQVFPLCPRHLILINDKSDLCLSLSLDLFTSASQLKHLLPCSFVRFLHLVPVSPLSQTSAAPVWMPVWVCTCRLTREHCSFSGPPVYPVPAAPFGWPVDRKHTTLISVTDKHTPRSVYILKGSARMQKCALTLRRTNLFWVSPPNWPVNRCWAQLGGGGPVRGNPGILLQNTGEARRHFCVLSHSGSHCSRLGKFPINIKKQQRKTSGVYNFLTQV